MKPLTRHLKKGAVRSDIAASTNRIANTVDYLSNTAKNTKIATGQVSDVRIEDETTRFTKTQICSDLHSYGGAGECVKRNDA